MNKKFLILLLMSMSSIVCASAQGSIRSKGFAVFSGDGQFKPYEFTRHAVGHHDIQIEILYAGICHSDVHHVRQDWGEEKFPMVPGHEIVGRVVKVGEDVTKFSVGDYAGIGCVIGSCRHCEPCENDQEQYCEEGAVMIYHDTDRYYGGEQTQGGYSNNYVVDEHFAIKVPKNADIEKVAPLLCAGITVYSPIRFAGVKRGDKVGVAGFGGLGHMAVQYMVKLGADVTVFDITEEKRAAAARLGASRYVNVTIPSDLEGLQKKFDFILSTIPAKYDPTMYLKMLKFDGQLGIVGIPASANMPQLSIMSIVMNSNRRIFGSQIGGIKETQEMLDYSVANNIYPRVEVIRADGRAITEAFQRVVDGKVKFRYVIDMRTLK